MERLEKIILRNLIYNLDFTSKVIPFLKEEYFQDRSERIIFSEISNFINKYKNLPTYEALVIGLTENKTLSESDIGNTVNTLNDIRSSRSEESEFEWLIETTEKFCQGRSIYNAIMESVKIIDGNSDKSKGEIPNLLSEALSISFDNHVGHDYILDVDKRFEIYHRKETKVPFDLELFNRITDGGISNKTLNIALAGTGVGKSLFMCHLAASCLYRGYDVLYITLEMAEEKIAERIDANLLNINIKDLKNISEEDYKKRFSKLKNKAGGSLIIKEYPTASASTLHFRALLNDLKLKKRFKPQIIFIDYLNICCSSRLKQGVNTNSYTYIKSIAEEIRGLAVEFNVPIFSATQTNRTGYTSSDPGLEDTSESFGLPATADFMFALISNEELEALGQIMVKQLKNRYSDLNVFKKFVIGVDKSKMRLYDTEDSSHEDIVDSGHKPVDNKFNKLKV